MSQKSGYEKAALFELYVARGCAWLLWLTAFGGLVLSILRVFPYGLLPTALSFVIVVFMAIMSAKCESMAEEKLKAIWETETLSNLASGASTRSGL